MTAFQKIPCVLPAERANTQLATGVSAELKGKLQTLETRPDVLTAGIATVQPWLDIPELGSAALVTTDGRADLARVECVHLASELWRRRREYLPEMVSIEEAVARASANPEGLVVLSDAADATTSGAPGDSVWILRELLRHPWRRPALVTVVAPEIVELAEQLPPGSVCEVELGV